MVSDKEIVEYIAEVPAPCVTAKEVADEFDHTRQWAHSRLTALSEEGDVVKKGDSGTTVIWYLPDYTEPWAESNA